MIDWSEGGWSGSIRRFARRELKRHFAENRSLRKARYPFFVRCLRTFMAEKSFTWFIVFYLVVSFLVVVLESVVAKWAPHLLATGTQNEILNTAFSYFIATEVGTLTVISLAVGLITIFAQGQNWKVHVRIYYHESLAYEVFASTIALLAVLCLQIFWPIQFIAQHSGLVIDGLSSRIGLTGLHAFWLSVNLCGLAYFVAQSLRFVEPEARARIREDYTANWAFPRELPDMYRRVLYLAGHNNIFDETAAEPRPSIFFGSQLAENEAAEIESIFEQPTVLYDVRMRLLSFALHRWWNRCRVLGATGSSVAGLRADTPLVVFSPGFNQTLQGHIAWCRRRGGVPFSHFEKFLIRWSFRFRREKT